MLSTEIEIDLLKQFGNAILVKARALGGSEPDLLLRVQVFQRPRPIVANQNAHFHIVHFG